MPGKRVSCPKPVEAVGSRHDWVEQRASECTETILVSSSLKPDPGWEGEVRKGVCAGAPLLILQLGKLRPREEPGMPKVAEGMRKLVQCVCWSPRPTTQIPEVIPKREEGTTRHGRPSLWPCSRAAPLPAIP